MLTALCFARAITPISAINMNILNAIGRSDLFLKVDLLKLPLVLTVFMFSVPFGIEVVAMSMIATSMFSFFINAYYPGRFFGFGGWKQIVAASKYIFASAIMYFAVVWFHLDIDLRLLLILKVVLGVVVYIFILLFLRDAFLTKNLFLLIKKIWPARF